MKRISGIMLVAVATVALATAQQSQLPGSQNANTNQNGPDVHIQDNNVGAPTTGERPNTPAPTDVIPKPQTPATTGDNAAGAPKTDGASSAANTANDTTSNANADKISQPPSSRQIAIEPESSKTPHTEIFNSGDAPEDRDPLLEPKPLPRSNLALLGGIAKRVDGVRNRMTIQPFGGGKSYVIYFDDRSRIFRDGRETTLLGIQQGDRVYVDTQTVDARIFARNINVRTTANRAQAGGQVLSVEGSTVRIQDRLSGVPVAFSITPQTKLATRTGTATQADLQPGALVDVDFVPGRKGGEAREVTIYATPGSSYTFAGTVTYVNIRDGVVAIDNKTDGRNYEIAFDPQAVPNRDQLTVGSNITTTASFDGKQYRASKIDIAPAQQPTAEQ